MKFDGKVETGNTHICNEGHRSVLSLKEVTKGEDYFFLYCGGIKQKISTTEIGFHFDNISKNRVCCG